MYRIAGLLWGTNFRYFVIHFLILKFSNHENWLRLCAMQQLTADQLLTALALRL